MARLLGVLLGSALAVAALIILVGAPAFLPASAPPIAGSAADAPQPAEASSQSVLAEAPQPEPQAAVETSGAMTLETQETPKPEQEPKGKELRWHAFWSPFRSRIAANGFVEQLQRVTGLDYRVVNLKPGVYEVAFAYTEDIEIAMYLEQISAATGLDVPGS